MSAAILYLHGFRSSPASWKARLLAEALHARGLESRLHCPALSPVPEEAIAQAEAIIIRHGDKPLTLIGSSLGGYYATWLAERYQRPAVLINPAVVPKISLSPYLGTQTNLHTGKPFHFTATHIAQLEALEIPRIHAQRYWLLVETGDEVLDYRLAVERYAGCRQTILPGGDHSFTQFPAMLPQLIEYCGL